jgi:hypothetical protein
VSWHWRLSAAVLLLAAAGSLLGQTITFDIARPSPGQFGMADLWNITLHNSTTDTQTVYFHVEGSDAKSGPLFVANSQEFRIAPGSINLTAKDIRLGDVWCAKGFEAFRRAGPVLPEGGYTYDITLVPEMSQTSVFLQVVAPKPLDLVWPPPGAKVSDSLPVFVWTRPVLPRYAGEYLYSVRVAEMRPRQSCSLATEDPLTIIEHCRSSATAWRYPATAAKLIPGRTYAWRVEA